MRDYYLHARGVVQVAERLLETARVPARAQAADRADRRQRSSRSTASSRSRIRGCSPSGRRDGAAVPRRGRRAGCRSTATRASSSPRRSRAIRRRSRRDPAAARLLLDALVDLRDAAQPSAFEVMHQLGILVGADAGVGAVHRARAARPLSRLHRRPAPALRARDAEAARARRARRASTRSRPSCGARSRGPAPLLLGDAAPRRRQAARQGPRREGRGDRGRGRAPARA